MCQLQNCTHIKEVSVGLSTRYFIGIIIYVTIYNIYYNVDHDIFLIAI